MAIEQDDAAQHQAAALALLESAPKNPFVEEIKPEEKVETKETKVDQAEAEVKVPETQVEAKSEEKKEPAKEETPEPLKRGFDSLAREKAALRKKEMELDAKLKRLEALENAKSPMDVLAAKGFSYDDVTRQLLGGEYKSKEKPQEVEPAWVSEFRELKQQLQQERTQNAQRDLENKFSDFASKNSEKLPYTTAKGDQKRAIVYLQQYVQETGELPGETIEDSISMAFQALEKDNQAEIEKAAALLTKIKKPAISVPAVSEKAVGVAESGQAGLKKTLTNSMASPGKPAKAPELVTPEDYQRAALALLESRETT